MDKTKVVLLFSGGFDSVVLLQDLIKQGFEPHPLFINYGQKPLHHELDHFFYWMRKFKITKGYKLDIPKFDWSRSSMFHHGEDYDGKDNDYIELRNMIFYSYAASYAESIGAEYVASAILANTFKDTNPIFSKTFGAMLYATAQISLYTPYERFGKIDLADFAVNELGLDLKEILENSISCNIVPNGEPCEECFECKKRKEMENIYL